MLQENTTVEALPELDGIRRTTEFAGVPPWIYYSVTVVLCIAAALIGVSTASGLPSRVTRWDFSHYYLSALSLRQGNNPYTTNFDDLAGRLGLEAGEINLATYPPTFLLLLEPLTLMPERIAYWSWQLLNLILFIGALLLLFGRSRFGWPFVAAMVALALLYPPVQYHFYFGQSEIPILFLLAVMMRFMERRNGAGAGLCLALAGLIKLFPLLLVGYLIFQRRWRTLLWVCIGVLAGSIATLWAFGFATVISYVGAMLFVTRQRWIGLTWNVSVYAVASRLFWMLAGDNLSSHAEWARRAAGFSADALLLYFTVARTAIASRTEDPEWRVFSLWVVTSVLLSPTAWVHYMVLFLVFYAPLAFAINYAESDHRARTLALTSYLLLVPSIRPLLVFAVAAMVPRLGTSMAGQYVRGVGAMQFFSAALCYLAAYNFAVTRGSALKH
jgi:hypothetical protein